MLQYIVRRLLQFIPVFFGVTLVLFLITTVLPVIPIRLRVGRARDVPAVYEQLRHDYGFDQPWYEQYVNYLSDLAHGDLGTVDHAPADRSRRSSPRRIPTPSSSRFAAIIIEIIVGVGAGIISAVKQYSHLGRLVTLVDVDPGRPAGVLARHACCSSSSGSG